MSDPGDHPDRPSDPDAPRPSEDVQRDLDRPRPARRAYPDDEDYDRGRHRDDYRRGPDAIESLIPYKNVRGLLAYYFGVFSLIPCLGAALGPAAFILGILGVRYANQYPEARGKGHAISGIVMGTITTLANWIAIAFMILGYALW